MIQYLTFELDNHYYGVGVEYINSVLDDQTVTPLPTINSIVTGLTNVRGNVVPVFDPTECLRETKVENDAQGDAADVELSDGGIIVFELENGTLLPSIGVKADRIGKVIELEQKDIAAVPDFLPDAASKFFTGFCFINGVRHSIINLKQLTSKEVLFNVEERASHA